MKLILGLLLGIGAGYGLTSVFAKRASRTPELTPNLDEPPPPRQPLRP
jgi:hypothetical protein